jgi:O-antigen/teichoic acid export membrane protein
MGGAAARSAVLTFVDQGFASVSNFVVGLAVARVAGVAGLGAFSLAYTCWILVTNVHRGLITDPMAIYGDARGDDSTRNVQRGFAAEIILGVGASLAIALVGVVLLLAGWRAFGDGLLALAPWVTFLNIQDYWRWIGFMQRHPEKSLLNDTVFDIGQAVGFALVILTHSHTVFSVVSAWGLGAAVGALYGLRQFGVMPRLHGGWALLRGRWHTSKWLASSSLTGWGATSLYLIVVGAVLGPTGLGGLKAAQALAWGALAIVMQAGSSIGLPEASRAFAARGWKGAQKVSRWVAGSTFAIATVSTAVMIVAGKPLLRLLYGDAFGRYHPATVTAAVGFMVSALVLAPSLTLKTVGRARSLFHVQFIALGVSVIAAVALSLAFGVTGAAATPFVSAGASLVAAMVFVRTARRTIDVRSVTPDAATLAVNAFSLPEHSA